MTNKELVAFLQEQNTKLISTIEELTKELSVLKAAILEKDKEAAQLTS